MSAIVMSEPQVADQPQAVRPLSSRSYVTDCCRDFVEYLVARAKVTAARERPGAWAPDVDWDAIWRAGDGTLSAEQAIGRIVTAAYVAAREISGGAVVPTETIVPIERVLAPIPQPLPPALERTVPEAAVVTQSQPAVSSPPATLAVPWVAPPDPLRGQTTQMALIDSLPSQAPLPRSNVPLSGWSTAFTWIRNIGAVLILFVVWQLWGTSISQHHAQQQLQGAFEAKVHAHHAPPPSSSGPTLIPAAQTVPTPAQGTAVAQLQIPAIQLSEIVVSGTAESDLSKGPGHYIGTAAPGQAGNVAIAGHRTTNGAPFNRLGQLAIGDPIYLTTTTGERLTYVVSQSPQAVSPSDVAVLDNFGDNRITLTTCNPEFSSSQRLVVVGELKQPNPPPVTKAKPRAYHVVNAQTASWDWSLLPVVVLEMGVLLLLGISNRRLSAWYGRSGRWFILVPLWGVGLYVLFGTLSMFLPAAI